MEPQDAYRYITSSDSAKVKRVVQRLKEEGLEVYLTGSAVESDMYADIDLLAVLNGQSSPSFLVCIAERLQCLDIFGINVGSITDFDDSRMNYMGSLVDARIRFIYSGTKFDVAFSREPFGLVPTTTGKKL